ncbi:Ankyrin repeat domain-containing protein 39 [Trebouxia sp. C0009 RCD-2024]
MASHDKAKKQADLDVEVETPVCQIVLKGSLSVMNGVAYRRNSHSCMVPTFLTSEVALAAQQGGIARVCKWLNEGGPIDARDVFQCSLLHLASASGQVSIVRELLRRGASLNERSPDTHFILGKTAMHRACEEGHIQVVELLVAAGANTQMACTATVPAQKQAKWGRRSQAPMWCWVSTESKSASDLCKDNAVRLALEQPAWSPGCHHMWPARFKVPTCACSCTALVVLVHQQETQQYRE